MKSILGVFLAVTMSVVVGCGGNECADCATGEGVSASACPIGQCGDPGDPVEPSAIFSDVKNTTDGDRSCHLSYSFILANGSTAPGGLLATTVPAGGSRSYNFNAPSGSRVVYTARCWHPGYPDVNEQATATTTTAALYGPWVCHAIYAGGAQPSMTITCGAN